MIMMSFKKNWCTHTYSHRKHLELYLADGKHSAILAVISVYYFCRARKLLKVYEITQSGAELRQEHCSSNTQLTGETIQVE